MVDEWKMRGARNALDYAILTNEIYKSGFGLTAKEYKKIKGIHKSNESAGMDDLKNDVIDAGSVMKKAKDELEDKIKNPVVSKENYLDLTEKNRLY